MSNNVDFQKAIKASLEFEEQKRKEQKEREEHEQSELDRAIKASLELEKQKQKEQKEQIIRNEDYARSLQNSGPASSAPYAPPASSSAPARNSFDAQMEKAMRLSRESGEREKLRCNKGQRIMEYVSQHMKREPVDGDGNCLYYSMSVHMNNEENYHNGYKEFRQLATKFPKYVAQAILNSRKDEFIKNTQLEALFGDGLELFKITKEKISEAKFIEDNYKKPEIIITLLKGLENTTTYDEVSMHSDIILKMQGGIMPIILFANVFNIKIMLLSAPKHEDGKMQINIISPFNDNSKDLIILYLCSDGDYAHYEPVVPTKGGKFKKGQILDIFDYFEENKHPSSNPDPYYGLNIEEDIYKSAYLELIKEHGKEIAILSSTYQMGGLRKLRKRKNSKRKSQAGGSKKRKYNRKSSKSKRNNQKSKSSRKNHKRKNRKSKRH
jgi:hypothetical protein